MRGVNRTLVRRLVWAVPTLLIVTFIVFLMMDVAPGDPAHSIAGPDADPALIKTIHHKLGLDQPLPERYARWVVDAAHGDLQRSLVTKQPVRSMVWKALPPSLSLVGLAMFFAAVIGFSLGVLPSLWPRRGVDRGTTFVSGLAISMPSFSVALLLVSFFAVDHRLFPALGYVKLTHNPASWFRHLFLPAVSLSLVTGGELARQLRGSLHDALATDFAMAARAKGLRRRRVVLKHGMKNAAAPVVTVLGVRVAAMLGATAIIEQVFLINGIGRLTVQAVLTRDVTVVLGVVFVATIVVLIANIVIDASYSYFNPRVRVE